ncbi:hypothetical protein BGX34_002493 [Mortierella sp. NVP85]|nr:hypothetical protein BGX34_002493 [Mortierella sp. NVP85]
MDFKVQQVGTGSDPVILWGVDVKEEGLELVMASTNLASHLSPNLSINPLELPEIRSAVGKHLGRPDLVRCLQVSRSWYASFAPLVWSSVSLLPKMDNPPKEAFIRNSQFIKGLTYHIDVPHEYRSTPCPELQSLKVLSGQDPGTSCASVTPIVIAQHEKLCVLSVYVFVTHPSQRLIWKPACHFHNLSTFNLHGLEIESSDTIAFWDFCAQLESLTMSDVSVVELPTKSTTFERLQYLYLSLKSQNSLERQLDWIAQCPNLRFLNWARRRSVLEEDITLRFIPGTYAWPSLHELRLVGFNFMDAQLGRIIGAMRDLSMLDVSGGELGFHCLKSLCPHFQSLRSLDIATCNITAPSLVPDILASCPHLKSLSIGSVMSQDILDGQPWICEQSLEVLFASFGLTSHQDTDYHQRQVIQRISRLTNLKELTLAHDQDDASLDLRLENGLQQLVTLKRLEKLWLYSTTQRLSVQDVEWMISNWKNLTEVGLYNLGDNEELAAMFRAAGIECGS